MLLTGNQIEYIHRFKRLYTAFLHSIRLSGYKMEKKKINIQPKKQNIYASKIVNVYLVYDLDASTRNPTNNLNFKNCLFGATSVVKKVIKKDTCIVTRNNI